MLKPTRVIVYGISTSDAIRESNAIPAIMIAGIALDSLIASEVEIPYTITLVGFNIMFLILGPVLYYLAGKFYESDKAKLARDFG